MFNIYPITVTWEAENLYVARCPEVEGAWAGGGDGGRGGGKLQGRDSGGSAVPSGAWRRRHKSKTRGGEEFYIGISYVLCLRLLVMIIVKWRCC